MSTCRPIIFSAAMVRAILAGRKSQTRGVVLAERIEETNSAPMWRELTQGTIDWVAQALEIAS